MTARLVVLSLLSLTPLLVYAAGGGLLILREGWGWPLAGLATVCWVAWWAVSKLWPPAAESQVGVETQSYWTPSDESAAGVVEAYQRELLAEGVSLADPGFYVDAAEELATRVAAHYRPGEDDPLQSLTLGEILAAVRLAVDDLEDWAARSLPGRKYLTVRNLRRMHSASKHAESADALWWLTSVAIDPAQSLRWMLSKGTLDGGREALADELTSVVAMKYTQLLGHYFIELNSGRLRGGAAVYREAFDPRVAAAKRAGIAPPPVTVALVGQVSSGKSSLVNALVGDAVAATDVLPKTAAVERFQAYVGDTPVVLLDTPGYGEGGADAKQLLEIEETLRTCDAALFVMAANSPGKDADAKTLDSLRTHLSKHADQRPPPLVGVVTKVDLLAPPLEWSPPYDPGHPSGPKESNIAAAVAYANELFGGSGGVGLREVVPVCSRPDRLWNVTDGLVPAVAAVLDDAQTVALLRGYEQTLSAERSRELFRNAGRLAGTLASVWVEGRLKSRADDRP